MRSAGILNHLYLWAPCLDTLCNSYANSMAHCPMLNHIFRVSSSLCMREWLYLIWLWHNGISKPVQKIQDKPYINRKALVHTQCVRDEDSAYTVYMSQYNPVHIEYSQSVQWLDGSFRLFSWHERRYVSVQTVGFYQLLHKTWNKRKIR